MDVFWWFVIGAFLLSVAYRESVWGLLIGTFLLCGALDALLIGILLLYAAFFYGLLRICGWMYKRGCFPGLERAHLKVKSDSLKLEILEMQLKELKTKKVRRKMKWRNRINTNI